MSAVERELRDLGGRLEWPPTPDVARAVAERIVATPRRTVPWWRRRAALAVALVAIAAAVVATLAVPSARTAVLRWLGLGSVQIVHVDELPTVPATGTLPGRPVTLAEAQSAVRFDLLAPPAALGRPDLILVLDEPGIVTFVWGDADAPRFTVTELPGEPAPWIVGKLIPPGSSVENLSVDGRPALWITGAHEIAVLDPARGEPIFDTARLAGNTLLVDRGALTLRLEGDITREQALELARDFP